MNDPDDFIDRRDPFPSQQEQDAIFNRYMRRRCEDKVNELRRRIRMLDPHTVTTSNDPTGAW